MKFLNAIKRALNPAPPKKEQQAESVRTVQVRHKLRAATQSLRASMIQKRETIPSDVGAE